MNENRDYHEIVALPLPMKANAMMMVKEYSPYQEILTFISQDSSGDLGGSTSSHWRPLLEAL